jgi:alpha-ketoglutarate-dependent taurine dioxygenase
VRIEPMSDAFGVVVTPERKENERQVLGLDWSEIFDLLCRPSGGVVMLRGFQLDEREFRAFTEKTGQHFVVHHNVAGRDYVDGDPTFATVAKSNKPIDFHIEMASSPVRPEALWFFCVHPCAHRGRIGFVDGVQALACLTGRTRQFLREHGFKYEFRDMPPEVWRPVWNAVGAPRSDPAYVTRWLEKAGGRFGVDQPSISADDRLSFDYRVPAVYRAKFCGLEVFANGLLDNPRRTLMGTGEPVPRDVVIEAYQAVYQSAVWLDWRPGDLAIVDNTRVMHAREAFEGDSRRVLVRYASFIIPQRSHREKDLPAAATA